MLGVSTLNYEYTPDGKKKKKKVFRHKVFRHSRWKVKGDNYYKLFQHCFFQFKDKIISTILSVSGLQCKWTYTQIYPYVLSACVAKEVPGHAVTTFCYFSVYTLDTAILPIVEGYRHGTVHFKCINDHTLRSDIFLPKCPTNLRVNTLKSDYLVGHRGLGRT